MEPPCETKDVWLRTLPIYICWILEMMTWTPEYSKMSYILLLLLCLTSRSLSVSVPTSTFVIPSNFSSREPALSSLFPYRYDIPNSQLHLNIGFGPPSQRLDSGELRSLLLAAQIVARRGARDHGSSWPLPSPTGVGDVFHYSLGAGITISITEGHYAVTWGILEDVLRGLENYLVDGKRPYHTRFEFTIASMPIFGFGTVEGTGAVVD
jgi:hypothetical protein